MTRSRALGLGLLILLPLLGGASAHAEDDVDAVSLSGLHAVPAGNVNIAAASLVLKHGIIDLTITTQTADAAAVIDVQGPAFKWLGEQDTYPDRQFPELRISVDGLPAALTEHATAHFAGNDITSDLKQAGIDPFAISQSPPVLFSTAQNQPIFTRLLASGAIQPLGGQDVAAWTAQRDISFTLPKGPHSITLKYKSRPASTLQPIPDLAQILPLASYCLTAPALQRAAAKAGRDGNVIAVQYAIPTSIDAKSSPTVNVELANPGGASLPASIAFFCGPQGTLVTAPNAAIRAAAKPDAAGIVHILTLGG